MNTRATLAVHGPRQLLRAFRKRVIEDLKDDAPEIGVTESYEGDQLHFQLAAPNGIPFPTLVGISAQYPDCVAIVQWTQDGAEGETTIQNGQVKEAMRSANQAVSNGRRSQHIRLAPDGSLLLAVALDITQEGIVGFCATSAAETYFKLRGGAADPELMTIGGDAMVWDETWHGAGSSAIAVSAEQPVALTGHEQRALEQLATEVRADWLWYAHATEEETIVERQRYATADRPVQAINVKSHKIAALCCEPGQESALASNISPDQHWIVNLIELTWARL